MKNSKFKINDLVFYYDYEKHEQKVLGQVIDVSFNENTKETLYKISSHNEKISSAVREWQLDQGWDEIELDKIINTEDESCIKVWSWKRAPEELRLLSTHCGDEDWIAYIPSELASQEVFYIGWLESGTPFGMGSVTIHKFEDGSEVRIGAHA